MMPIPDTEKAVGVVFHPDVRRFLHEASDVVLGAIEPVTIGGCRTDLIKVVGAARASGLPNDVVPVCQDNGDCYYVRETGEVGFWSHNGGSDEHWPDLATWIRQVWIAGN